jgi:hypothetical protein
VDGKKKPVLSTSQTLPRVKTADPMVRAKVSDQHFKKEGRDADV